MRIETGSQNASRIPGNYAYIQQRYNPTAVESVEGIQGDAGRALRETGPVQPRRNQAADNPAPMRDPVYDFSRTNSTPKFINTGSLVDRFA